MGSLDVQALVCLLNRVLSYKLLIRGALTHRRGDVHRRRDERRQMAGRMTLRINGSDHGKDSDSEHQTEKHNLRSLVTE